MTPSAPTIEKQPVFVHTFGNLAFEYNGNTFYCNSNGSSKKWGVLVYLLLNRNRAVTQTELIDVFWDNDTSVNPSGALKTLLYRLRHTLYPLFGEDDLIVSGRGVYYWNSNYEIHPDSDKFDQLCTVGHNVNLSSDERMEAYTKAIHLYQGSYLPLLQSQLWLIPRATHYQTAYVDAVLELANLLIHAHKYCELNEICALSTALEPLDEHLHALTVKSHILQGNTAAALEHYEKSTDYLYKNLGIHPSAELQALYEEIIKTDQCVETDLYKIQNDLSETVLKPGAFVCDYSLFREIYRLEARRCMRSCNPIHIALITVLTTSGNIPKLDKLGSAMEHLLTIITLNLRQGDVVSKYSGAQYVILLFGANYEDSEKILHRISCSYRKNRTPHYRLAYKIRELLLPEHEV